MSQTGDQVNRPGDEFLRGGNVYVRQDGQVWLVQVGNADNPDFLAALASPYFSTIGDRVNDPGSEWTGSDGNVYVNQGGATWRVSVGNNADVPDYLASLALNAPPPGPPAVAMSSYVPTGYVALDPSIPGATGTQTYGVESGAYADALLKTQVDYAAGQGQTDPESAQNLVDNWNQQKALNPHAPMPSTPLTVDAIQSAIHKAVAAQSVGAVIAAPTLPASVAPQVGPLLPSQLPTPVSPGGIVRDPSATAVDFVVPDTGFSTEELIIAGLLLAYFFG